MSAPGAIPSTDDTQAPTRIRLDDEAARTRMKMVILCSSCCFLNYADRVNMSVVIVPMKSAYAWSTADQSNVMLAFFIGYCFQIFGALLCRRFGAKRVLTVGAATWSLFTFLTPLAADAGFAALLICRFLMGVAECVAFPSVFHFLANWVPSAERGRAVSIFLMGTHGGTTFALLFAPQLAARAGWRFVLYSFGLSGVAWVAVWHHHAYDRIPEARKRGRLSPTSSEDEDEVVEAFSRSLPSSPGCPKPVIPVLAPNGPGRAQNLFSSRDRRAITFILTSPPLLSVCAVQFATNFVHYIVLSWLPTYFSSVYKVDVASLSFTAVPYITMGFCCSMGGVLADMLVKRGMPLTKTRKLVQTLSNVGAALFYLMFCLAHDVRSAILFITLALGFQALGSGGYELCYLDCAEPALTGTFKAVANTMGALSGVLAMPYTTLVLKLTQGSWRIVFGSLAMFHVVAIVIFVKYSTSNRILVESKDLSEE